MVHAVFRVQGNAELAEEMKMLEQELAMGEALTRRVERWAALVEGSDSVDGAQEALGANLAYASAQFAAGREAVDAYKKADKKLVTFCLSVSAFPRVTSARL
jgi:hypothetical protein